MDPQARHTRKSKSKRRDGFRGHVAAEPDTGLITDCEMTMAAGPGSTDADNGVKMAGRDQFHRACCRPAAADGDAVSDDGRKALLRRSARQRRRGTTREPGPGRTGSGLEVYGDSAYGSGQARADYHVGGHDTFIKPGPVRPAVPGGLTIDDFLVDEEQGTVTCPNGVTRPMSSKRTVTFGAACAAARCAHQCTTARLAGR